MVNFDTVDNFVSDSMELPYEEEKVFTPDSSWGSTTKILRREELL